MIYHDQHGYYIIEGIGNRIYLPEGADGRTVADFITDYFKQKSLIEPSCSCSTADCEHCGT